ncbi:ROK family protein [uncultured Pseudokineococcus sp.]|uniref:ROK family protein n=1 Tax=uncultured Pseudokineococcus sp. TaxID=1642928 RepID=UPI002638B1E0|nr:ROK family protein [uncultured Pseudokineococcus sp.]
MGERNVLVAGVDVGGTNIQVGLVSGDHEVHARAKALTPTAGPDAVFDTIAELVASLGGDPVAVGVGIPGVVHAGQVLTVPNLVGWGGDVDLVGGLTSRLPAPVTLGNDANVGLLGEWVAGAARGARDVLGLWMGTGIGGGLVLDGRPYEGARGSAGEIGHVLVQPDGALCGCGRRGCVEAYAGRRSMGSSVAAMVEAGWKTDLFDIQDEEEKTGLTSKVWARALAEDDELAQRMLASAVQHLGVAVGSVVNLLDVELVVVGGGMPEKLGQDLADRIEAAARPWMLRPSPDLRFVVSSLEDDAGVVGAAALARSAVIAG